MWFIVKTDAFAEQRSIDLLREKYGDAITDVYFPLCRRTRRNEAGEERKRFVPVLQGMFFIRVDNVKRLERVLSPYGYFMYRGVDFGVRSTEIVDRTFFTKAHLLCADSKALTLSEIVRQARIPDADMERFMYYNDCIADGIEGLTIVDKRYSDLVLVNDTIRIIDGPLAGWTGVVKQIKTKGRKDRHLLVRFGNNHCLNISNIRQYAMLIEHEAPRGAKAEAVGAWRAIDQMIGYLQAKAPNDNASATLRRLFFEYQQKLTVYRNSNLSDKAYRNKVADKTLARQQDILLRIDPLMHNNFRIIANYLKVDSNSLQLALHELIPDAVLRPFLTPTSGVAIAEGRHYAVLQHNGITELIVRCNLRDIFHSWQNEACGNASRVNNATSVVPDVSVASDASAAPESDYDYDYYAHFALLPTTDGKVKALCSWGGFYDYYAAQNAEERQRFLADLETKRYPRLLRLLTYGEPVMEKASLEKASIEKVYMEKASMEKASAIGGFSITTPIDYTDDTEAMAAAVAQALVPQESALQDSGPQSSASQSSVSQNSVSQSSALLSSAPSSAQSFYLLASAAVEVWQGARLLVWRKLLQRYVLLHKEPVKSMDTDK